MISSNELSRLLEGFHSRQWLHSDPLQFPHRYSRPEDQEVAAFIAACFAYGSVALIHRAVERILAPMGERPADFVRRFDGLSCWSGFIHRFHREGHVVALVSVLRRILGEYGSVGEMFRRNAERGEGETLCERVLDGAVAWLHRAGDEEIERMGTDASSDLRRGMRFFFNSPAGGSACKRMLMFLRWMVRQDQLDLGLWRWMRPRDLVIPADTHVGRISYYLRLRGGREGDPPTWKMAKEITRSLASLNPEDPVAYDFALARLGILDICKKHYVKSICERCPVEPACRYSNRKARAA